ncbi:MAG: MbtH family protein [Solimonas sp.]
MRAPESLPNPFDDDSLSFLVLRNAQGQYSLWPTFAAVPGGWEIRFGPDTRAACIAHVEEQWLDIQPFAATGARA